MQKRTLRTVTAFAASGLLLAGLTACAEPSGSGASSSSGSGSSSSSSASSATPDPTPTPVAEIPKLTGVHTQVTLDAGFVKALTTLKLTPGTVGKADLSKAGVLTFPITGGNVKYFDPKQKYRPYVQGTVEHDGSGISLTGGKTKVELTDFVIDPGNNSKLTGKVTVNGKVAAPSAELFRLDGSTLKPLTKDSDGNAVLEGTTVYVSDTAAKLLNQTFKTTAVTGDLKVGIAKITAK